MLVFFSGPAQRTMTVSSRKQRIAPLQERRQSLAVTSENAIKQAEPFDRQGEFFE